MGLKRNSNFKMVAKTLAGFEPLLSRELKNLGAGNIEEGIRSVSFEGDLGFLYKANLGLRTAIKILKPIHSFYVRNEQDLYDKTVNMNWSEYLGPDTTFAIDSTVHSESFTHSLFVSQKVKDGIVDNLRNTFGRRPDVDIKSPDVRLHVHIQKNHCNLALDSSGSSLHQRGYKTATNIAPINEVLAAGLLLLSGWDGRSDFMDPMCGSGTLLIEAAMIACNMPANLHRPEFAFQRWPDYDPDLFTLIRQSGLNKVREIPFKITGFDKAPSAVRKAQDNIENAGLSEFITVERKDFFSSVKAGDEHLHMVFNPPYGERLNVEMESFYSKIGDTLKRHYAGTQAWFITSNLEALKHVGLRTSRKIKVFNSHLESRLVQYVIYDGSMKEKKQPGN